MPSYYFVYISIQFPSNPCFFVKKIHLVDLIPYKIPQLVTTPSPPGLGTHWSLGVVGTWNNSYVRRI